MIQKLRSKKGFTLMEMLIVVAIIAILVAIAIPAFNSSLNKARLATDEANIRAAYAEAMVNFLDKNSAEEVESTAVTTIGKNTDAALKIGGIAAGIWDKGATVVVKISEDGLPTINITPKSGS